MGMPDLITTAVSRDIFITDRFEALHQWPQAPEEVAFLRHPHRHVFHVKVMISVTHSDRQVEFIMAKRTLSTILKTYYANKLSTASCEHFAEDIGKFMVHNGYNVSQVEVSEDGENGAVVEFLTTPRVSGQRMVFGKKDPKIIKDDEAVDDPEDAELKDIRNIDPLSDVIEDQNVPDGR